MGAVVVYVIMNWSRSVIMDGVARLCWRWMAPNCFTYRATVTLDGDYIGPPFSSKYPSFRKMLHTELGFQLNSYQRLGCVILLTGFALNYIWVYFFLYFSDSRLYYDPNSS